MAKVEISYANIVQAKRLGVFGKGYRAQLCGANNEVVFTSEVYNNKRDAEAAARAVTQTVRDLT